MISLRPSVTISKSNIEADRVWRCRQWRLNPNDLGGEIWKPEGQDHRLIPIEPAPLAIPAFTDDEYDRYLHSIRMIKYFLNNCRWILE